MAMLNNQMVFNQISSMDCGGWMWMIHFWMGQKNPGKSDSSGEASQLQVASCDINYSDNISHKDP